MKIIISPAKKMKEEDYGLSYEGLPVFLSETQKILEILQNMSFTELKKLWACNDKIAEQNVNRLKEMDLQKRLVPAILSYDGIAYQYMAPSVFKNGEFAYIQEHLRILSAFYGVVKPMDGVTPYRLEMQAKLKPGNCKDLYAFWKEKLYQEIVDESHIIINLASREYSKCIETYLKPNDIYITCVFGELAEGKIVQKGVYAKMARGEMVRYMAEHAVSDVESLKSFDRLGYRFSETYSNEKTFVFLSNKNQKTEV